MYWSRVAGAALCFSPGISFTPSADLSTSVHRSRLTHLFAKKRGFSKERKNPSKETRSPIDVEVSTRVGKVSGSGATSLEPQSIPASNTPSIFDIEDTLDAAVALQLLLMGEQLETDECKLAAKLVQMSLLLNHDPESEGGASHDGRNSRADGAALDSASPAFEKLMARLRQSLDFGDKPWLWPLSDEHGVGAINNAVEGGGVGTEEKTAEVLAAFVAELESSVVPLASNELTAMHAHEKTKEIRKASASSTSELGERSAVPTWDVADYGAIAADWSMLHLWRNGEWVEDANNTLFPATCAALRHCLAAHGFHLNPMLNVGCGIARQPAGTGISRHCDGNLLGVTVHLGLDVPPPNADDERAWIEVGGERQHWANGKAIVMDTTFAHQTHNPCSQDRYVLMFQLLRPGVLPHQVGPVQRYLGQEKQREPRNSLHGPSARRGHAFLESSGSDLRELQPFLVSTPSSDNQERDDDKNETSVLGAPTFTVPAYPGRMLQKSAEDPSPATFKVLKPCYWRSAPSWSAPLIAHAESSNEVAVTSSAASGNNDQDGGDSIDEREEVLEAGAEVLPVAFTLDEDGGVGWIACCAAPASSPFAHHVAALVSGAALREELASNRRLLDSSPALLRAHSDLIARPEAHLRWCPVLDECGEEELLVMEWSLG